MDRLRGHSCLSGLAQGTVCKILDAQEVKPHKCATTSNAGTLSSRPKMAQVLCVYSKVNLLKKAAATAARKQEADEAVTVISYDEKPGISSDCNDRPDLPPELACTRPSPRVEYKRHGTVSLLAGIDLVTGKVQPWSRTATAAREFIDFLSWSDAAYPTHTAIR